MSYTRINVCDMCGKECENESNYCLPVGWMNIDGWYVTASTGSEHASMDVCPKCIESSPALRILAHQCLLEAENVKREAGE